MIADKFGSEKKRIKKKFRKVVEDGEEGQASDSDDEYEMIVNGKTVEVARAEQFAVGKRNRAEILANQRKFPRIPYFKCLSCPSCFTNKNMLREHKRYHQDNPSLMFALNKKRCLYIDAKDLPFHVLTNEKQMFFSTHSGCYIKHEENLNRESDVREIRSILDQKISELNNSKVDFEQSKVIIPSTLLLEKELNRLKLLRSNIETVLYNNPNSEERFELFYEQLKQHLVSKETGNN